MNANVLDAIDALYLGAFRQNLLQEVLRACVSIKLHLRQSASLATAQELPPTVREDYGKIAARLPALVTALVGILRELEAPPEARRLEEELGVPGEAGETIAMLDAAEIEILSVLNALGTSLGAQPDSMVRWDGCARLKTRAIMHRIPGRACYDLETPIYIAVCPFLIAEYSVYSAKPQGGAKAAGTAHYLVNEIVPVALLPLLEAIQVEVEVRGEAYVSCCRTSSRQG